MTTVNTSGVGVASEMLDRAHRLIKLGFSVIPLQAREKEPDYDVLPRGTDGKAVWAPYQTRKPTETELQTWFGNGVARNIGIVVTDLFVVVETDTPEAETWCATHLPLTPMMTRSARGWHRYYLRPTTLAYIPAFIETDGLKIEVKSDGKYLVGPGSIHPGKPEENIPPGQLYSEVEPWPSNTATVPFVPIEVFGTAVESRRHPGPPLPETLPSGGRNATLFTEACRLRRLGWEQPEIANALVGLNRERCNPMLATGELQAIAKSACRYPYDTDPFPLTEQGDAEFFAACYADGTQYDQRRRQWLWFDTHHWALESNGEVHRFAVSAIRERQALALKIEDETERKKRMGWAIRGEERKRHVNLLALAQNTELLSNKGDNWDTDGLLLGVRNGVLDLRTGRLRDGSPADRVTKVAPVLFDPTATCPRWARFVREIFADYPDVPEYMQRVFGYTLTGEVGDQAFWILWGEGANGKTTLLETFSNHVLGKAYSWTMPFPAAGWTQAMSEYQRACLDGPRLFQASEVKIRGELNEQLVKLISGGDELNGRHPCGRPFDFRPVGKLFLRVNHKPIIHDQTHAMWRRVKLVPFTRKFPIDPTLGAMLAAEAPGILAWAVRGCLDWQQSGLAHPKVVEDATLEYKAESDTFLRFIGDMCVEGDGLQVRANYLFEVYQRWCRGEGVESDLNVKTFGVRVKTMYKSKRTESGVVYVGLGLLVPEGELGM